MNSKTQMASVSLVGAIPGLALSIVLVISLVSYFGTMTNMFRALAALTLLVTVGLAMLPVVIMVFGSKAVKDESDVVEKSSEEAEDEVDDDEELVAAKDDEEETFDLDEDVADEPDDLSDDDFVAEPDEDSDDVFMEGDEEEFDMGLFEDEK